MPMTPQQVDNTMADLASRGIVQPKTTMPDGEVITSDLAGLGSAPPAIAQYAHDLASEAPPQRPAMGAHAAPGLKMTPQSGLAAYGASLTDAPPGGFPARQPVSMQTNEEIPEVAMQRAQQAQQAEGLPVAPAPQYIPAHFDERNVPIRPETRKAILGTYETIAKAQYLEAQAKQDEAAVVADRMGAEADRAKRSMAMRMSEDDERRAQVRKQLGHLNELTQAAQGGRIDEGQVWREKGSMGRLAASIGIALGAGLQARNGGRNVAADILDNEIARNIEVQKANLSLADRDVTRQDNLLGRFREIFGDERAAEMAYENTARELAIQQIQAEAAKRQVPAIQANAAQVIAHIRQQQLETQARFEQMAFVRAQTIGGGGAMASAVKQDANIVRLPGGRVVRFASEKEAIEARSKLVATYNTIDMYDQAKRLRSEIDKINPVLHPLEWSNKKSQLDALAERILPEWSLSHGQGQVKEEEAKRYKQNLFPFKQNLLFNGENADAIIDQGRKREEAQIENLVRGSSGEFVDTNYGFDKTGKLQQDVELRGEPARARKIAVPPNFKPFGAK